MAAYSPPATPTPDVDIWEDLLKCLDEEIMAMQNIDMMKLKGN